MMTLSEAMAELESLANPTVVERNLRRGAGDIPQFGVMLGDIRKVAKKAGSDHELGLELWDTGNIDARQLALLLIKPKRLSPEKLDQMVREAGFVQVFDWLDSYVVRKHPDKEKLRLSWMADNDPWALRAGWSLTAERVGKDPDGLDLPTLLDRIEAELAGAAEEPQWTMNNTLAGIGIHFPEHRERAMRIGENLGVYRDYPTPKNCTSPFAPIWITEIVRRNEAGA